MTLKTLGGRRPAFEPSPSVRKIGWRTRLKRDRALLIMVAIVLVIETKSLLLGEAASPADVAAIAEQLVGGGIERVIHLRTMHLGPDHVVMTASVRFRPGGTDIPAAIVRLKKSLAESDPLFDDVTIEPAPDG